MCQHRLHPPRVQARKSTRSIRSLASTARNRVESATGQGLVITIEINVNLTSLIVARWSQNLLSEVPSRDAAREAEAGPETDIARVSIEQSISL